MRQYIGQKDPTSLRYSSKLFLNENNDGFYQTRLLSFKSPINERKLSDSERLMWQSFLFFKQKLGDFAKSKNGGELASFLSNIVGELMMFIQITVEDELNAYTVFETLNSRGVELTSTDLLKNFLFSLVAKSETDLRQVKMQWKKIIDTIGLKEFPIFLRYFELLDQLEFYAYNYVALGNPEDDFWSSDKENRSAISILKALRVTQWKPLAMVAAEKLSTVDFKRFLNSIIVLSYRYNVIAKLQTNEMEKVYSKAAINLFKGYSSSIDNILNDIKILYVNDDDFKNYFALKQFNTGSNDKKLARYTLYKIEAQEIGGNSYDFENDNGTIEHILPESYPEIWHTAFTEDEYERNIFLLGNLTLLEASKNNKEAADKSFDEKKEIFATSKFAITKKIDVMQWTPQSIRYRQAHLAKIAATVWKIPY